MHPTMASEVWLSTVQQCKIACEYTISVLLQMPNIYMRRQQIKLLRDCADICSLTEKFVARGSHFARYVAAICADICFMCAQNCLKHADKASQICGQTCLYCAKVCRKFNTRGAHGGIVVEIPPIVIDEYKSNPTQ